MKIENYPNTIEELRSHLEEGANQAKRGEFITQSINDMLAEFKKNLNTITI